MWHLILPTERSCGGTEIHGHTKPMIAIHGYDDWWGCKWQQIRELKRKQCRKIVQWPMYWGLRLYTCLYDFTTYCTIFLLYEVHSGQAVEERHPQQWIWRYAYYGYLYKGTSYQLVITRSVHLQLLLTSPVPANTRHWPNAGILLADRDICTTL